MRAIVKVCESCKQFDQRQIFSWGELNVRCKLKSKYIGPRKDVWQFQDIPENCPCYMEHMVMNDEKCTN